MSTRVRAGRVFSAAILLLGMQASHVSAQISWALWDPIFVPGGGTSGTMIYLGQIISMQYSGPSRGEEGYSSAWQYPIYGPEANRPTDLLRLNATGTNRITFSAPVINPFFAIISLGRADLGVSYDFNAPFTILTDGPGFAGTGRFEANGTTLTGYEGHGMIQFQGTYTSLEWTNDPYEDWHAFTIGAQQFETETVTPEPVSMMLLGTGLAGVGALRRRRRKAGSDVA